MSLNRFAKQRDENEPAIVEAFRKAGCTVVLLDKPVDLLIGYRGVTFIVEIKRTEPLKKPKGERTRRKPRFKPGQEEFMRTWRGSPVWVVESVEGVPVVLSRVTSEGGGRVE